MSSDVREEKVNVRMNKLERAVCHAMEEYWGIDAPGVMRKAMLDAGRAVGITIDTVKKKTAPKH
jgi:hypothetical protein